MNVVIVDADISFPATSGKRLRTLNLMLQLAPRHRITYLARSHGGLQQHKAAAEFLREHGIEPVFVEHALPRKSGPLFYGRLVANLASDSPYSITSHESKPLIEAAKQIAKRQQVDVWQLEWASYLKDISQLTSNTVLMAHNVESLLWQRDYEVARSGLRKWYMGQQWRKFERFERTAYHAASRVIAVSGADADQMASRFNFTRADVVENGVDTARFAAATGDRHLHRILFLGALDWRPNIDGLNLLLNEVFPRVRQQNSQAELVIVGRNPSAALLARAAREPRVSIRANVPDVRPYLQQSTLMVVPLRIGGGSRLKILEALAAGLPVVSTGVGAEGLNLIPGVHYQRADSATELAACLTSSLADPSALQDMAEQGRAVVCQQYDWAYLAEKLERVWLGCVAKSAERVPANQCHADQSLMEPIQ